MKKYRFGFDVGTNSLGWSVLETDDNTPTRLLSAGVRIFADGRDTQQKETTLKAQRREARSARRRRDRFLQRQKNLLEYLTQNNLFPTDKKERLNLQKQDPLTLRADALSKKLQPYEIGRALFHLNQRRGFKSNRKDSSKDVRDGSVSRSIDKLLIDMELMSASTFTPMSAQDKKNLSKEERQKLTKEQKEAKEKQHTERKEAQAKLANNPQFSFGVFLHNLHEKGKPIRARRNSDSKLYDFYPTRDLLRDEFNKICKAQQKHHPALLSEKVVEKLAHIIFYQNPLKPQERGICTFIGNEKRAYRAMPSFQRYRIYQEINNLSWQDSEGEIHMLKEYVNARDDIVQLLEQRKEMAFNSIRTRLRKLDVMEGDFKFNLESEKRTKISGNTTSYAMLKEDCIGKAWSNWSPQKQNEFIDLLLSDEDDENVLNTLQQKYELQGAVAQACLDARLEEGTANVSVRAADLLTAKMQDKKMSLHDAIEEVAKEESDFDNPYLSHKGELLSELPYYGEAFYGKGHIISGLRKPEDKHDDLKYHGGVSNPTVHIAMNQIRRVTNELIRRYGKPYSIAIELGRDLPAGENMIKELRKEQTANQKRNEQLNKELEEKGQIPNHANRLLLRLWQELGKSPTDRFCPYSGKRISPTDLFNGNVEIDHILPFSSSLDDSYANKILCTRQANRDKGQQTPYEAFGKSDDWENINRRIQELPVAKRWRFAKNAREKWEANDGFTARHLNDTRYIGRMAREYLAHICPSQKIDVVTGRLTALLRKHWGLNSVLSIEPESKKKNRDDHRHHAVDAIVIGMTTRSMIQKVSTVAGTVDGNFDDIGTIFRTATNKGDIVWDGFRQDVQNKINDIIVSHKPNHKKSGALHEATAFGIVNAKELPPKQDERTPTKTPIKIKGVSRIKIEDLFSKLPEPQKDTSITSYKFDEPWKSIRSSYTRDKLLKIYVGAASKDAFIAAIKKAGFRAVRCITSVSVVPIRGRDGKVYKAYKGGSNWAVEIYEMPNLGKNKSKHKSGDWVESMISRFDANQKTYQLGQTFKPHPAARLVMRLHINDCIEITQEGKKRIMRLQKMSQGRLAFAEHHEANVDKRNRDGFNPFAYTTKSVSALKQMNARQVYVSPTGLIRYKTRNDT